MIQSGPSPLVSLPLSTASPLREVLMDFLNPDRALLVHYGLSTTANETSQVLQGAPTSTSKRPPYLAAYGRETSVCGLDGRQSLV